MLRNLSKYVNVKGFKIKTEQWKLNQAAYSIFKDIKIVETYNTTNCNFYV